MPIIPESNGGLLKTKLVFMSLILSFQLILSPVALALGEGKSFSSSRHLAKLISETEAKSFETKLNDFLLSLANEGVESLMKQKAQFLTNNERAVYQKIFQQAGIDKIEFKQKSRGYWELKNKDFKISFTLSDIYEKKLKINDKEFVYKDIKIKDMEKALENFSHSSKTSYLKLIFEKTIGIESAHGAGMILGIVLALILGVLAAVTFFDVGGQSEKLKETVTKLNEVNQQLISEKVSCEESPENSSQYDKTFSLAYKISNSKGNSLTSIPSTFEHALKEGFNSNTLNEDCFLLVQEVGKKLKLEIPLASESESRKQVKTMDVNSAVLDLCNSYNDLKSCMDTFIGLHVSDVEEFKRNADYNPAGFARKHKKLKSGATAE